MTTGAVLRLIKKLTLLGLLLTGGCVAPTGTAATPTSVDVAAQVSKASTLVAAREYSAALDVLQQAATLNPQVPTPRAAMGQVYLAQHRWELAADAFDAALTLDPENYAATVGAAEARLQQGQHITSRAFWRRAIRLDSTRPDGYTGLGRAYLQARDYPAARLSFATALSRAATPTAQWYWATLTLPTNLAAGEETLRQISSPSARRDYLLAALKPFSAQSPPAEVAATTGIALIQLDEWQLAHHALSVAVELDDTDAKTWAFLGYTQATLGLPAMDSFNRAKQLDPSLALTLYFEGIYLRKHNLYDVALDSFLKAMDLDPGNLAVAIETAVTLAQQGDLTSAEAWYRSVVQADPDSVAYQQLLTDFYVSRSYHVVESGLPAAERLVKMAPDSARAFDLLGWARFQTGDYAGAEDALRKAIALDQTDIASHYHLGRVLRAQHREAEAQAEFTHVIDWDASGYYRDKVLQENK